MTPAVKTQNAPFLLRSAIANRRHGGAAWAFVREHWDEANDRFPSNTIVRMVDGVKLLNTPELVADVPASSPSTPSSRPPRRSSRSSNANGSMPRCAAARASVRRIPRRVELTTSSGSVTASYTSRQWDRPAVEIRKATLMKKFLAGAAALAAVLIAILAGASSAQEPVSVMLLHGVPGVTVDVVVDGAVVIPGFEPGDMQDLCSFAGQTLVNLEVRVAGTDDVAIGPVAEFAVPLRATGRLSPTSMPTARRPSRRSRTTPPPSTPARVASPSSTLPQLRPSTSCSVMPDRSRISSNGAAQSLVLPAGEIAGAEIAPTGGDPIAPFRPCPCRART